MASIADAKLQRVKVAEEIQPKLRLYRRLWISSLDLREAQATIGLTLGSVIPHPRRKEPSPLLTALTTALVVSYARPFVNSRGHSDAADRVVPGSLLRVLTSVEREIHDSMVDIRNTEVAHSDADVLELALELFAGGDGGVCRVTRRPFLRAELHAIDRIIKKLLVEIDRRCEELRQELPLNVWL